MAVPSTPSCPKSGVISTPVLQNLWITSQPMPRWGLPQGGGSLYGSPTLECLPRAPQTPNLRFVPPGPHPQDHLPPPCRPAQVGGQLEGHPQPVISRVGNQGCGSLYHRVAPNLRLILGPCPESQVLPAAEAPWPPRSAKPSASSNAAAMSPPPSATPLRLYKKDGRAGRAHARRHASTHARTHAASQVGASGAQRVGTYSAAAARWGWGRWLVTMQDTPTTGWGLGPGRPLVDLSFSLFFFSLFFLFFLTCLLRQGLSTCLWLF